MNRLKNALGGVKNIKFTRRTLFYALGVAMVAVVTGLIVWLSTFLAARMNDALTADPNIAPPVRFDIEGFEKLGLTR